MPLFMDIHIVDSDTFSVEDVVRAHMQDLAIQERFSVTQIKYWVNVAAKTLFCLMEGPDKEACNAVHRESHGNTACNIIEVTDDEFELFLGQGKSINDLAHTNSGDIDTGYRTLFSLNIIHLKSPVNNLLSNVQSFIKKHNGTPSIHPDADFLVSFVYASDAIRCALAIESLLKSNADHNDYFIGLVSGRPVDEQGNNLFEETKRKLKHLLFLGAPQILYLDYETKELAEKEGSATDITQNEFRIVADQDFIFLSQIFDLLYAHLHDSSFKSAEMNRLIGSSKSQTYRRLKSLTGLAPNQLIQELRLRLSLKTLLKSGKTISEVAFELGFNSPTYYTKVFRNRFATTPSAFSSISKDR